MQISDDDLIKALARAGVPARYRNKDVTLTKYGKRGKIYSDFVSSEGFSQITKGGVAEVIGDDSDTTDLFYLLIRAAVMKGVAIKLVNMIDLASYTKQDMIDNKLLEHSVLAIEGLEEHRVSPFGERQSIGEWRLMSWLNEGKGVIFLTGKSLKVIEMWGQRIRNVMSSRKVFIEA